MYNPQLETFFRVADAGSFNKVAEEQFITPTAVIKQVIGMTAALPLLMGYGLVGETAYEWIGMAMLLLFLLHLFLNRRWFGALGKGRYSPARIAQLVLNCLIFLCMASGGNWQEGHRFSSGASDSDVQKWVNELGL